MKSIIKRLGFPVLFFAFISFSVSIFYMKYVNFSIDAIILFLSTKMYFGKWLLKGIFPLYNPQIYLGVPFAFDIGLGNFHPFNLFFILPYPYSFALWMGITSLLYLLGFFYLFRIHTKSEIFALLLTFILFFSGSGVIRSSNPTILAVVAHYGIFLLSLYSLKKSSAKSFLLPLLTGLLMTLSGHVQFVFYGYMLGFIYAIFFVKVPLRKLLAYFIILGTSVSWYFLLSVPLVLESTRLTHDKSYITTGDNTILQYAGLFFPYLFGYVQNGSKWGPGTQYILLAPLFYTFAICFAFLRRRLVEKLMFLVILAASLGLINFPFFRGAGQIVILLHILGLIFIAEEEDFLMKKVLQHRFAKPLLIVLIITSLLTALFTVSALFSDIFVRLYKLVKHGQESLFFDRSTVKAIGSLVAASFIHFGLVAGAILYLWKIRRINALIVLFVIAEGLMLIYHHAYYIPATLLRQPTKLPISKEAAKMYRIQTASDVIPYFGFATYMGDMIFRPPFSKEKPVFDKQEEKSLKYLKMVFAYIPTSWIMTTDYSAVQGYNTFMLANLAKKFSAPSADFKSEYQYIIARNNLFAESKQDTSINSISSGHLTLNDPRWEELGVRYFISDRPLKRYKLLGVQNGKYLYEDTETLPIYRVVSQKHTTGIYPIYQDPNTWRFNISKKDVGGELQMVMNPGGFAAYMNGRKAKIIRDTFLIRVKLTEPGELVIQYSPLTHLSQTLSAYMKEGRVVRMGKGPADNPGPD